MVAHGLWTGQGAYLADVSNNDSWWLDGSYTSPPGLTLRDATIGSVHTDNWWSGQISTWGPSTITNGIHVGAFSGFAINQQRVGSLELDGNSSVGYHTQFAINGGGGPYRSVNLNGTLALNTTHSVIDTDVTGNGNIVLSGLYDGTYGNTEMTQGVQSGETIWALQGRLQIDQPQLMHGDIYGLGGGRFGDGLLLEDTYAAKLSTVTPDKVVLTADDMKFYGNDGNPMLDLHLHTFAPELAVRPVYNGVMLLNVADNPATRTTPSFVVHQTA